MPAYLIAILAAGSLSAFARQLGDALKSVRLRFGSPRTATTTQANANSVELYVKQPDGEFAIAADGELSDEAVRHIIDEIDQ